MYSNTPPAPPPKPGSHDASRMGTPATTQSPRPPPPIPDQHSNLPEAMGGATAQAQITRPESIPDPGDQWLPKFLQDKSKQDLADILSSPALLNGLTHASSTIHPSLSASHEALQAALNENVELATHLLELESRLAHQRSATQGQLLSTHALERQWRQKQSDMDRALSPFAPASLYQRLGQGVQEQEMVCLALEESFLEGEGADGGTATERETMEWVRRYREAKKLYYLRQERKERWDEGRVGGWR
ncbi:hypothetical protein UCRPA7_7579 [Phaeoacremonium minimum UCRPA7]|uniref:VPS37 C-terminal domain-containing protein n=1 Tax=Phaeoacremonium minimum (strain UCR-PA7) TaxID=1286976 RepID=R8BC42_PHAM7|nr:hypothetical protein UCRPA7_7579 [Phaeoacremonium minimum UCRPA7]EON96866.1 hypothetical protein UCRPA7_7579 [Phaeoacremonium minimum UCRPA7]